ncbi:rhomboid protease GluP [Paraburkholderia sacchari]|uniref:rhomboid family intramembrane serine protease n=1 Tax=Paraburkholderia sacchari TaxID=159450 RepID=UPI0039A43960
MSQVEPLPEFSRAESERLDVEFEAHTKRIWVTWAIVASNVLVFILMIGKGADFRNIDLPTLIAFGGNFGPHTLNGEVWRLLTASFVHQSLEHVALNMLILGFAGAVVERQYGNARFAALYVFAAITGNLASLCSHYWLCNVGASGAIVGVIGALLAYVARFQSTMGPMERSRYFNICAWIAIYCLYAGFTHSRVDAANHLGGLLGGFILGWILGLPPSETDPQPTRLHTSVFACAIAAIAIVGLGLRAVHETASPDAQKLLAYAQMMERASLIELRLNREMKMLGSMIKTPDRRKEFSTLIYNSTWPKWNELFDMVANAPLPEGSPLIATRSAEMRYCDDMRQAVFLMAGLAADKKVGDGMSARRVKELLHDAEQQRLILMHLALGT